jgi:alkanesulfonate monooxygenase SsuD/methylene tetrahydromethanopterin reductase-like flavin-dependent oxidoreductase (luciferase family)
LREDPAVTILGAVFLPQLPPERLASVARAADEAGLEELWLWEDCFRESGIATAATVLALTARARIGIGLLPAPLRNVALTAMEVATLDRLFPDRARVCVGHGVQEWMGQVGARVESPLSLLREYIVALRRLLAGETVTTSGRYVRLDRVALDWPPATPPPVLAGAVGPRSLRLSGECADGTVLTGGTSPGKVRQARALIDQGRGAVGRSEAHSVVVYLHAATGHGAAQRLADEYQRWGYGATARDLGVAGDAVAVAEAVQRWAEAGASTVVLQPTADDPDPEGFVRFVAEEVRPLVPVA